MSLLRTRIALLSNLSPPDYTDASSNVVSTLAVIP
jgi:hypothetical protein